MYSYAVWGRNEYGMFLVCWPTNSYAKAVEAELPLMLEDVRSVRREVSYDVRVNADWLALAE